MHFVCLFFQIIGFFKENPVVSFLKDADKKNLKYFPDVPDESRINHDQILKVLTEPVLVEKDRKFYYKF